MRTLVSLLGAIVGVFALGLVAGGIYRTTSAENESAPDRGSLEAVLRSAPSVDCGEGREAVLAPASAATNGGTAVQIKCVATSAVRERVTTGAAPRVAEARPVPVAAPVSAPVPVVATAPTPTAGATSPETTRVEEKTTRSNKEAALIIGGSAGAGAGIGAIAKGKKGAAVGAAIGGAAGTIYHLLTRDKTSDQH